MRQFVCEQVPGCSAAGCVLILPEHNVLSHRECLGCHGLSRICALLIGVDAYPAEVVSEARLEKRPRRRIERLTR